jgi:hypothetical protein
MLVLPASFFFLFVFRGCGANRPFYVVGAEAGELEGLA